jgi:hypothetical protein
VNDALELHDSDVISVESTSDGIMVRLAAYVHRSDERPGIDAGVGVSQTVELKFTSGIIEKRLGQMPCTLWDGCVLGTSAFEGMIPIPTSLSGAITFEAEGVDGTQLVIRALGLDVTATSEPVYIEDFP